MAADGVAARGPDRFPATLGPAERRSTRLATVVGIGGMTLIGAWLGLASGQPGWLVLGLPFALTVVIMARLAPTAFRLAGDGVHIERGLGPTVIPYHRIRGVDRNLRLLSGVTLGGSRGIYGRFGRHWNPSLGLYRLFLTNREAVVWLDTRDGWVGLSPDRPDEFVARLQERLAADSTT